MILYTCVAAGERILAEHEHDAVASPLSSLAAKCLRAAPRFHALYTHTVRGRIYAFLMNPEMKKEVQKNQEDNDTDSVVFFAIADEALGREKTLLFLRRLRDSYCKCRKRKRFDISRIVEEVTETKKEKPHLAPPPGAAPLALPQSLDLDGGGENVRREKKGKRRKDGEEDQCSSEEGHEMEIAVVDCDRDHWHHLRPAIRKKSWENVWRQHVRVVILLDLVICSIMFGIWLAVCRGVQCMASS